jgi:hypothetical protein
MRRFRIAFGGSLAVAAITVVPWGGGGRPLPLHAPEAATSPLLAIAFDQHGSKLEELDPSTFTAIRASAPVGWYDGWVVSPDRTLLGVATHADSSYARFSTIRFANSSTLRWVRRGVRLDGYLRGAIWPRAGTIYALAADWGGAWLTLDTIDTVAKKIVARTTIVSQVTTVAHSVDGLVLLGQNVNAIAPATVTVVDSNGGVRSVGLARILMGTHFDQSSQDPIGTTREPGLAVDPVGDVAYIIDLDGLVAEVRLSDLAVSYHKLGGSLRARLAAWLMPPAEAKGVNGLALTAHWLGDGLIAVTGTNQSATRKKDGRLVLSSTPDGLRVIDTNDWSERTLDVGADRAIVVEGLLLAGGNRWRSDGSKTTSSGEGLAAYGADGSLRWRLESAANVSVIAAYGSRALIQKIGTGQITQQPLQLVDLDSGQIVGTLPGSAYVWPLLGSGS